LTAVGLRGDRGKNAVVCDVTEIFAFGNVIIQRLVMMGDIVQELALRKWEVRK
jgi:hypothetical protein